MIRIILSLALGYYLGQTAGFDEGWAEGFEAGQHHKPEDVRFAAASDCFEVVPARYWVCDQSTGECWW